MWLPLLIIAGAAICCLLGFGSFLPRPEGGWTSKDIEMDRSLTAKLTGKRLSIYNGDGVRTWISPKEYLIQDAFSSDLDMDGEKDLILLLWKIGKYGSARPFWVEEDEKIYSQHVFIYSVSDEGKARQKWCASEIGREIKRMKLMEKNNSLILTEDVKGLNSIWRWESFGLKVMENGVSLVCFGDNIIHKEIYEYAFDRMDGSFDFLYSPFAEEIRSADIAVLQQETMLVDNRSAVSGYPKFGSPIEVGQAVVDAGFDVASCAGNHALDRGMSGIDATTDFYADKGITCLGVQNGREKEKRPYEIVNKNGISFAMFDLTYGTGDMDVSDKYPYAVHYLPQNEEEEKMLLKEMDDAKEKSDCIIVFVHWGIEYETKVSDDQRHMAELFAKGGADLVIGTHPHVIQEVDELERDDGTKMPVFYSLGNFRAYQGMSEETKCGGKAKITFWHTYDGVKIKDYELAEIDAFVDVSE